MTKITDTPAAAALSPSDAMFLAQGSDVIKHFTLEQLLAFFRGVGERLTAPPNAGDFPYIYDAPNGDGNVTTLTQEAGHVRFNVHGISHNLATPHFATKNAPPGPTWTIKARMRTLMPDINYAHFGLMVWDPTTTKMVIVGHTGGVGIEYNHWTVDPTITSGSPSTFIVNTYREAHHGVADDYTYAIHRKANGNLDLQLSLDGETFNTIMIDDNYLAASDPANLRVGFGLMDEYHSASLGLNPLTDMAGLIYFYEDDAYPRQNYIFDPGSVRLANYQDFPKNLFSPAATDFPLRSRARGALADATVSTAQKGGLFVSSPDGTTANQDAGGSARGTYYVLRPIPPTMQSAFEFAADLNGFIQNHDSANYGIVIADDAGNSYHVGLALIGGTIRYYISGWNAGTSTWYDFSFGSVAEGVTWFKIAYDNTGSLTTSFSRDGRRWVTSEVTVSSPTDTLAHVNLGQPTKYGFCVARYDAGAPKLFVSHMFSTEFPEPNTDVAPQIASANNWRVLGLRSKPGGTEYITVAELRFLDRQGRVVPLVGAPHADKMNATYVIGNAFDGDVSSLASSLNSYPFASGDEPDFGFNFTAPVAVYGVQITASSGFVDNTPREFAVQYQNPDSSWTTVSHITGVTPWTALEKRTFRL